MQNQRIQLLDCTLRDGGYVNDWLFGEDTIVNLFERLVSAGIDIIEVGFLDERRPFDINRTIMPGTEAVNRIYGNLNKGNSLIVGMIDYGTCGTQNICNQSESFLDGIRVIFKKQKMHDAIDFCRELKQKGYKVFAQAVSITSYEDDDFDTLIELVNELEPYAFSLVDTYGLLHKKGLMHYYNLADQKLKPIIGLGYHAHNNFQLAYANCIELIENPPKERTLIIDGTLYGMGKSAGNAPIELLVTYMKDLGKDSYHSSQLLEAIDTAILDIYSKTPWGYNFKFFLSASHDCHPNYVSYLMDQQKLSIKGINEVLEQLQGDKKLLYNQEYIEELYLEYQKGISGNNNSSREELIEAFRGKQILLVGPGPNIYDQKERVAAYIEAKKPVVISVNYISKNVEPDYLFVSSSKRYVQMSSSLKKHREVKVIATSNVTSSNGEFDFILSYSELLDESAMIVDNPMVMLLHFLGEIGIEHVALAGFDGYSTSIESDYVNPNMEHSFSKTKALEINKDVVESIKRLRNCPKIDYITDSLYA